MLGLLASLIALFLVVAGFVALVRRVRSAKGGAARGRWLALTIVLALGAVAVVTVVVVGSVSEQRAISRPVPSFPSLISSPDPTLEGKVAFVAEKKDVKAKAFDACAVVAEASGAARAELSCWPFDPTVPVTVRWTSTTSVEITAWDRTGQGPPRPIWSKRASLDGRVAEQEASAAVAPTPGGTRPPSGTSVRTEAADGSASITLVSPEGSRRLLDLRDAQLWWGLVGQSAWSPAGTWVATLDSTGRLLLTTTASRPSTRILATGVIGLPDEIGMPALAVQPS